MSTDTTPMKRMAGDELQTPKPDLHRAASSTSIETTTSALSPCSEASNSTADTTPHHSRAGSSNTQDVKPSGLNAATEDLLSDQLKQHLSLEDKKTLGTGLSIPRNATPGHMPRSSTPLQDPWAMSYPAPSGDVDVGECLARKKLYKTGLERQQERQAKMSVEERDEHDAKIRARDEELERERRAAVMKRLLV